MLLISFYAFSSPTSKLVFTRQRGWEVPLRSQHNSWETEGWGHHLPLHSLLTLVIPEALHHGSSRKGRVRSQSASVFS